MNDPLNDRADENEKAVKTTIVGGRPPGQGRRWGNIPRGIEVLIKKASVDPAFRQALLEERAEAAHEIDLELSPAEVAVLNAVPRAQIEKIIENTRVPDLQRRAFLGQVGAVMLAALTSGLSACSTPTPKQVIVKGVTKAPPTPTKRPIPTPTPEPQVAVTRVVVKGIEPDYPIRRPGERLGAQFVPLRSNKLVIDYECAFEVGEITIDFRQSPDVPGADIAYQSAQSVLVSKGSGEISFLISGTGGTTHWLIVRLRDTAAQCQEAPTSWPPREYVPGEYVEECAVWRIVEYYKEWPSKE